MPRNLLLTGSSGVGKSTLLAEAVAETPHLKWRGFVSEALISDGERIGWEIQGLGSGMGGPIATEAINSEHSLGRFGVYTELFEKIVQTELSKPADIYAIDEIGVISSWLPNVELAITEALSSNTPCVAIVRQNGTGMIDAVKRRGDVEIWDVTQDNRDHRRNELVEWIKDQFAD